MRVQALRARVVSNWRRICSEPSLDVARDPARERLDAVDRPGIDEANGADLIRVAPGLL